MLLIHLGFKLKVVKINVEEVIGLWVALYHISVLVLELTALSIMVRQRMPRLSYQNIEGEWHALIPAPNSQRVNWKRCMHLKRKQGVSCLFYCF